MKIIKTLILLISTIGIFVRPQTTTTTTTCDITLYSEACYSNKNCAFVESQKDTNKFFACLAVQAKDCNFFCNYFNELNREGSITSVSCYCAGIKYPTSST